jgi:cupin 2 domain-containing protein
MASASSGSSTTAITTPMASGMTNQPTNEWVLVLQGAARLEFEDRMVGMSPGDYINNPAHQKHRVAWTSPDEVTIWLAVFYDRTR